MKELVLPRRGVAVHFRHWTVFAAAAAALGLSVIAPSAMAAYASVQRVSVSTAPPTATVGAWVFRVPNARSCTAYVQVRTYRRVGAAWRLDSTSPRAAANTCRLRRPTRHTYTALTSVVRKSHVLTYTYRTCWAARQFLRTGVWNTHTRCSANYRL